MDTVVISVELMKGLFARDYFNKVLKKVDYQFIVNFTVNENKYNKFIP